MRALQRTLSVIFPNQCLLCDELVDAQGALCPKCWAETPFNQGLACATCAAPLIGEGDGMEVHCDNCIASFPPWSAARSPLIYAGAARRIVLGLKHGDRLDLVPPAASWMAQAGADLLTDGTLLCPVPIHWSRRIRRKYNQSAELCRALAARTGVAVDTDILRRRRSTTSQEGLTAEERAENQAGSMFLAPRAGLSVSDAEIVIVDDVMASGATLSVATDVLIASGAKRVSCLLLARAVKAP